MSQLPQPVSHTGEQSNVPGMPVQLLVPWVFVHAFPHVAQFDAVPSCVSQPAVAIEQSMNPELHAPMVQTPVLHDAAAFK
jgi:hypothetical protein